MNHHGKFCDNCKQPVPQLKATHNRTRFCSNACKQAKYRRRKKAEDSQHLLFGVTPDQDKCNTVGGTL